MAEVVDKVKRAAEFTKEAAEEKKSELAYNFNKEKAKASELPISDRASGAVNAVKDKAEQLGHGMKKEWNRDTPSTQ
jgi:hypothetical protein